MVRRWLCLLVASVALGCAHGRVADTGDLRYLPAEIRNSVVVFGDMRIRGEVRVFPRAVLSVRPGSRFLFERHDPDGDGVNDSRLVVEGRLVSRGDPDAPVVFTSAAGDPEPGDWLEVNLERSEGSVLEYTILEYSRYGLHVHFSSGVVANSVFWNNIDGTRFGESRFLLLGNRFQNNDGKGVNLRQSRLTVAGNRFVGNRHGLFVFEAGDRSTIQYNHFAGNTGADVRFGDFYQGPLPAFGNNTTDHGGPPRVSGPVQVSLEPAGHPVDENDTGPQVLAVEMTPRWSLTTGAFIDVSPVPAPPGKRVVVATWEGELLSLGLDSGGLVFASRFADVIDSAPLYLAGPADGEPGRLVFPAWDRKLRSVDARTGRVLHELEWKPTPGDDHRQARPVAQGGQLYVGLWSGEMLGIDPAGLTRSWTVPLDGPVRAAAAYDGQELWVGTDGGTLYSLRTDGTLTGSMKLDSPVRTTPGVVGPGDVVVLTRDGVLSRIRERQVIWRRVLTGPATYASPLILDGEFIAVADGGGDLSLFDSNGALLWRTGLNSAVHALARAGGDLLWAGTEDGRLAILSLATGRPIAQLRAGGAVHAPPLYVDRPFRGIVWTSRDGTVRAHGLRTPRTPWSVSSER